MYCGPSREAQRAGRRGRSEGDIGPRTRAQSWPARSGPATGTGPPRSGRTTRPQRSWSRHQVDEVAERGRWLDTKVRKCRLREREVGIEQHRPLGGSGGEAAPDRRAGRRRRTKRRPMRRRHLPDCRATCANAARNSQSWPNLDTQPEIQGPVGSSPSACGGTWTMPSSRDSDTSEQSLCSTIRDAKKACRAGKRQRPKAHRSGNRAQGVGEVCRDMSRTSEFGAAFEMGEITQPGFSCDNKVSRAQRIGNKVTSTGQSNQVNDQVSGFRSWE